MITFLTLPRAFTGAFDKLQRMALRSWREGMDNAQIILFGDEPGSRQAAIDLDAVRCLEVGYNETGRPLVDRIFAAGERYAAHNWICYCSADVTLDAPWRDLLAALDGVPRPFVIGQRWDIEPDASPDTATLHPPCGMDYCLYRRGTIGPVLPFVACGGGGDNWRVWKALTAWNMTVIDATQVITAIHVNHPHPEWANGKQGREGSAEQAYNRLLYEADGMTQRLGVDAAPWALTPDLRIVARQAVVA